MKEGIPENSLPAIEHSVKAGVEMIELDARPTSDGVLVLMHDNTIDRTTNGSGAVGDFTYQQLQQFYLKECIRQYNWRTNPDFGGSDEERKRKSLL